MSYLFVHECDYMDYENTLNICQKCILILLSYLINFNSFGKYTLLCNGTFKRNMK